MRIPIYQIDAFSSRSFAGNPAAVCPLDSWLDDGTLQAIAEENNLSETAFFVKVGEDYQLRWFTPTIEVALCGHATLATAYVISKELKDPNETIVFSTKSGELRVDVAGELYVLDFPQAPPLKCEPPDKLFEALGIEQGDIASVEVLAAEDYLVVLDSESDVSKLTPNFSLLKGLPLRGVVVTAPGDEVDFVSRWFGPNVGVDEDPVTGSAHCMLTPYWAGRLSKRELKARQVSKRGGDLSLELTADRVKISGYAVKYMQGEIFLK